MIIVRIWGGLGNQLFGFALCEKLINLGREVKVDKNYFNDTSWVKAEDKIDLKYSFFGNSYNEASPLEIERFGEGKYDIFAKIKRKVFGIEKTYIREKQRMIFDPRVLQLDDIYLAGYWQNERYFSDIREQIIAKFSFPDFEQKNQKSMVEEIQNTYSVSIHLRRGDYLKHDITKGICDYNYYRAAMEEIGKHVNNPVFFIFSNDLEWARENYKGTEYRFVDCNKEAYEDMHMMSLCKHNIIANSSFSWWGAWLNQSKDKIVVSPNKWFNVNEPLDIWCDDWIRIGDLGK